MEEYITRTEFEQFKRQMEQKTEEMKALRVDVHNVDVEAIKQELHTVSNTWLETLQEHYNEHTARFGKIEKAIEDLPTKEHIDKRFDAIAEVQKRILTLLQQKPGQ